MNWGTYSYIVLIIFYNAVFNNVDLFIIKCIITIINNELALLVHYAIDLKLYNIKILNQFQLNKCIFNLKNSGFVYGVS